MRACASSSRSSAACGDARPTNAVADRAGLRKQFQHRGGDDAERAFRSHEQMLEIVAGVVLLQLAEVGQEPAVGQRDFDAEHEIARRAVGNRGSAAGIGGEIAADRRRAFRRKRQGKEPVGTARCFLRGEKRRAGLDGQRIRRGVDLADLVETAQRQHDLFT